jgi:hypothetical protein
VSAIYAQDPAALQLPEELPSLDRAVGTDFETQISGALAGCKKALQVVRNAVPPLELPSFETDYPYVFDAGASEATLAVRLSCAGTVYVVVAEQHAAPPPPPFACQASAAAAQLGAHGGASADDGGAAAEMLGVTAAAVRAGMVPAGRGLVVHACAQPAHGGFTHFVELRGLAPAKRYAAYLALEDSFETFPPNEPRALRLHARALHFATPTVAEAAAARAAEAAAAPAAEPSAAHESDPDPDSSNQRASGGTDGGADGGAESVRSQIALLARRRSQQTDADVGERQRHQSTAQRADSDPGRDVADRLRAARRASGRLAGDDPSNAGPAGPPVKRPTETEAAVAARVQAHAFVLRAQPELLALDALEADVRSKLLDLGRYFGEPKSNPVEVVAVLKTLKDFLVEFKKVRLDVLEQKRLAERLEAQAQAKANRRQTVG